MRPIWTRIVTCDVVYAVGIVVVIVLFQVVLHFRFVHAFARHLCNTIGDKCTFTSCANTVPLLPTSHIYHAVEERRVVPRLHLVRVGRAALALQGAGNQVA